MLRKVIIALIIAAFVLAAFMPLFAGPQKTMNTQLSSVLQPNRSPLVSFRILFLTGAADDPKGKEGLASLTAAMLAKGGSRALSYEQIVREMYPLATSFGWQTDKEMTVFTGTTHVDNLAKYYALISRMLLDPGFRADDFTRLKTDAINFLKVGLRASNDEELGKEYLYNVIYAGHPYGHHNLGRVSALEKLTLDDVRDFYRRHYTQANLVIGLAGGYPASFPQQIMNDFAKLPAGVKEEEKLPAPKLAPGTHIDIIERETRSTAISLGFPIDVKRGDHDWPALALVASYFGQHRSSNSYLYQRLREARGLNYGDYAYIEYFPRGMYQFTPDPNLARQQQIFQIWIRPVEPQNGHFALRAALYEYDRLVRDGLSREAFESTREFLSKYANILTQTQDDRLGYALDNRYYNIPEFGAYLREQLSKLTLDEVNRAIREHLKTDHMRVVIVTKDAAALREAIISNRPSPITYLSPKPKEITDEDKAIETYQIKVRPEDVTIVPVSRVFE
ncbi:MAG TPA: pitrilysin family protein [Blastocatellia bacterium]|nr:pitrilysin family protein [Blastocatellia bacterium]